MVATPRDELRDCAFPPIKKGDKGNIYLPSNDVVMGDVGVLGRNVQQEVGIYHIQPFCDTPFYYQPRGLIIAARLCGERTERRSPARTLSLAVTDVQTCRSRARAWREPHILASSARTERPSPA